VIAVTATRIGKKLAVAMGLAPCHGLKGGEGVTAVMGVTAKTLGMTGVWAGVTPVTAKTGKQNSERLEAWVKIQGVCLLLSIFF